MPCNPSLETEWYPQKNLLKVNMEKLLDPMIFLKMWTNHLLTFIHININLTWGRLFRRLREMAPEPHPTSKHVNWASVPSPVRVFPSKSVNTSSTNSFINTHRGCSSGYRCLVIIKQMHSYKLFFYCTTSVSGLGMNTGGLIFKVKSLKSHSSITYCTGILPKTHAFMNIPIKNNMIWYMCFMEEENFIPG